MPPRMPPAWFVFFAICPFFHIKGIVIFRSGSGGYAASVPDFHGFYGAHGHDGFCQTGVQLIKNRFADSCRNAVYHAFHHASCRIVVLHAFLQIGFRLCGAFRIGHACGRLA